MADKSKNKICAILNLKNHLPFSRALKHFGWCDTYLSSFTKKATGLAVSNKAIDKLNINFKNYDVLLLQHERTPDDYAAKLAKRQNPNIVVIGNQHGYYKSILEIKNFPPDSFDYWNTWGQYWLDRSQKVLGKTPPKWINIGSYLHGYYYQTKKWQPEKTNKKALVIYEPNSQESYGSAKADGYAQTTTAIIEVLEKIKLPYDIKAHPLWPDLKGNKGTQMWQPPKKMKDFDVEKIINYSLVLGSRSTVLLDAVAMGIPVISLASQSEWEDDNYGPAKEKLFPYSTSKPQLKKLINRHFNQKINYNYLTISYFLGDIKNVGQAYLNACQKLSRDKYPFSWLRFKRSRL